MADTLRVRCGNCQHYSEIQAPAEDYEGPVVWLCPHAEDTPDGPLTCGHRNVRE